MRRVRESGSSAPARFAGHRRPMLDEHEALVRTLLDSKPDTTLSEMQSELARQGLVVRATSTILRWLRRAGLTRKKDPESCRTGSAGRAHDRPRWRVWQRYMDPARFVFLD
jgi:putative transposase